MFSVEVCSPRRERKALAFFLVDPEDALKLLNYHQERLRDLCARASSYQRNRPVRGPIKPAYVAGPPVPGQSPYPIYPVPPAPVIQRRLPAPTATRTERDSESKVEEGRASTSQWQDDEPSINSDRDLGDDEGMSADRKAGSPYYTLARNDEPCMQTGVQRLRRLLRERIRESQERQQAVRKHHRKGDCSVIFSMVLSDPG